MTEEQLHEALRDPALQEIRRRLGVATPAQIEAGAYPGNEEFAAYTRRVCSWMDGDKRRYRWRGEAVEGR